jgi:5-methylcytosine-specific restriction endonuclease McrA
LVADILASNPICQRCGTKPSTEVHEIKSRARGGSITDPANCVALCGGCHQWITTHPAEATADGWLKNSWDAA